MSSCSRYSNRSSSQSDPSKSSDVSYALARSKSTKNNQNLTAMVKKFISISSTKPKSTTTTTTTDLLVPDDFMKMKKQKQQQTGGIGRGLHKKLFGSSSEVGKKKSLLTLTDVKPNSRTLAMVLRSERELLSQNKEQESEIADLNLMLQHKNTEVDKLKDLCLKQRQEIKALKDALLFPDKVSQVEREILPTLQSQVTSLTGQLHSLAQELAEVKAHNYSTIGSSYHTHTDTSPTHDQANSLELSSSTPGSPDDMFLNDLNPCLTPYGNFKSKSKEFENTTRCDDIGFGRKASKSSKNFSRRLDENNNKYTYAGW